MEKQEQEIIKELNKLKKPELVKILSDYIIDSYEYMDECGENFDNEEIKESKPVKEFKLLTPIEIKEKLDETVIGQDDTKIKLATEVFRHYLRIMNEDKLHKDGKKISKNNILLSGTTGCGKTLLAEQIAKIFNVPIYIDDVTTYSSAGYVGIDVEHCVQGLLKVADGDIELAERGIIVLDEIDKLSSRDPSTSTSSTNVGRGDVQESLLKIIEGKMVEVPSGQRRHPSENCPQVNTSNILFIGCGAFQDIEDIVKDRLNKKNKKQSIGFGAEIQSKNDELSKKDLRININRDDLKKYGMMEEILGRFSVLSNLHPLEKEDLVSVLKNQNGLFDEYKTVFDLMNKQLIIKEDVYEFIAEKAIGENLGARSLKSIAEDLLYKLIYTMPSDKKKQYVIDKKYLENIKSNVV